MKNKFVGSWCWCMVNNKINENKCGHQKLTSNSNNNFWYLISLDKWQVIGPQTHMGLLCGYNTPCHYDLELIQPAADILPHHFATPPGSFSVYYSSKLLSNRWPLLPVPPQFFLHSALILVWVSSLTGYSSNQWRIMILSVISGGKGSTSSTYIISHIRTG